MISFSGFRRITSGFPIIFSPVNCTEGQLPSSHIFPIPFYICDVLQYSIHWKFKRWIHAWFSSAHTALTKLQLRKGRARLREPVRNQAHISRTAQWEKEGSPDLRDLPGPGLACFACHETHWFNESALSCYIVFLSEEHLGARVHCPTR